MTDHWIEDLRYTPPDEIGSQLEGPTRLHGLGPGDAAKRGDWALALSVEHSLWA